MFASKSNALKIKFLKRQERYIVEVITNINFPDNTLLIEL